MSKRRTEPEVIVFEEPKFKKRKITTREKDICRSADVTHLFSHKPETNTSASGKSKKTEELDFKATLLEVQKYAVSSLTGKNKRRREEEQIIALGGKPAKSEKMPFPLYHKKMKTKIKKERRERRELLLSGMPVPKKNERPQKRGKGRWKDNTHSLTPHVGTFTKSGLSLSKKDIAKVKASKTRKH